MAEHLKDMRLSPDEAKTLLGGPVDLEKAPKFPHGLRLHLSEEVIQKLEMGEMPKVGTELMLTARVTVEDMGFDETQEGGKRRHLGLQITAMALDGVSEANQDKRAEKLFGETRDPATRAGNLVETQDG